MRVFGIILFLVFLVAPPSLFAQQGGTGGGGTGATSSISTGFGDSYGGVQNVSEQAAGTFVGGGRPTTGFVGTTEIYNTSSSRSANSARQNTATRTAVRPVAATATQRRVATAATRTTLTGNLGNQTIRSATSIDFDFAMPQQRIQPVTVETHLNRVNGIQDCHVTFRSSPVGTTAVLTGTVATDRERRVAQQFLLMEPGISRVENLLEIR